VSLFRKQTLLPLVVAGISFLAVFVFYKTMPDLFSANPSSTDQKAQGDALKSNDPGYIEGEVDLDAPVGGAFSLIGVDGAPVRAQDFRGRYMLIVFGYSFCPDVCPMSLLAVSNSLYALEQDDPELAAQIAPIFVTLDPERDTPAMMGQYLKSFHPAFTGITGAVPDIQRMATAYAVRFSKTTDEAYSSYLIDHTTNIMLMGREGEYLTHFSPQTPPSLMAAALKSRIRR
jgi:protein SCO1/2